MAERSLKFAQGEYYHIYNRGCGRDNIFRDLENYSYLLRLVQKKLPQFQVTIIAYCLMPNHYHFILRQDTNISAGNFIQSIFNSYSKAFNKRYKRSGTLFEGPFQAKHINKQDYLIHLCRYIHRNPVDAGLVKSPAEWPFFDYCNWIGAKEGTSIDKDFIENIFYSAKEYETFVKEFVPPSKVRDGLNSYLLG
jgi:putative transposase